MLTAVDSVLAGASWKKASGLDRGVPRPKHTLDRLTRGMIVSGTIPVPGRRCVPRSSRPQIDGVDDHCVCPDEAVAARSGFHLPNASWICLPHTVQDKV